MPSRRAQRLIDCLAGERDSMLALLESLVAAESPSIEPSLQEGCQRLLAAELDKLGFRVRVVGGRRAGGHLLAVPRSRLRQQPTQLLLGHSDTVWSAGTVESMPVQRRGDRICGPGVFDMKGGLVMMIYALKALAAVEIHPAVAPVVFVNSDEEIGSPESGRHIARLARSMDRVWVLEPAMGRQGRIKTGRKGVGEFTLRVLGRAAHAGLEPGRGVNAIVEISHVIQQLSALNRSESGISVNVGTIGGGQRSNVVASEAFVTVDVRFRTVRQAERIEAAIRAIVPKSRGARLEIAGGILKPPLERTPRNRKLWQLAREAGRELDLELQQAQVGGASDGNTASIWAPTLDGLGPVGGGAHAAHEFVLVDRLVERTALLTLLLVVPPMA